MTELARLVDAGWAFVLCASLRCYCSTHADRVRDCTCRTHPDRSHLCAAHGDAEGLVWTARQLPAAAAAELAQPGAAA
ncbi:hypothetical protein [Leucobacter massiliensis]|uniref:hypothetical protein n=1 Tax=Leucobacter massiliensis TaxID=1686285 RepID=UPI000D00069B|nr:hypothetical protein [Leucobacter massiliensis]